MNRKSRAILLFAVGIFVLGFASYANAGDLMEDALASIERSSPELAGAFENIFAIPETRELAFAIEAYFQQDGSIKGKQLCPHWRDQYSSICEFLDDLNLCADWLEEQLTPKVNLVDMIISEFSHLSYSYLQSSAPLLTSSLVKSFVPKEDEIYFCDQAGKCPSWYYHFLRGRVGFSPPIVTPNDPNDPNDAKNADPRRSFVRITYANTAGDIAGALVFYVTEPNWMSKAIPVVWRVGDGNVQTITLSCYIDFFDDDGYVLDELARLMLLVSYWTVTDVTALDVLQKKDYYFGFWFMGWLLLIEVWTKGEGYHGYIDLPPQSPLGIEEWDYTAWPASPLLVLTDNWYYQILIEDDCNEIPGGDARYRKVWSKCKHPDYFDHITLWVSPQAGDINIEVDEIEVNLNGRRILHFRPLTPLIFNRNSPLDLSNAIKTYRLLYVADPENCSGGDCWLPRPIIPPVVNFLKAAAQDYAQGWDYRYGVEWDIEAEIWRPLPASGWCGAYACYMLKKYMPDDRWNRKKDHLKSPRDCRLGEYFRCMERNLGKNYYITYTDNIDWEDLTDLIKPGYYVDMWWNESKGEYTNSHGAFFIDWVEGEKPTDDPQRKCWATFYAIGGNQNYGRVYVNRVHLLRTDSGCSEQNYPSELEYYKCYWGDKIEKGKCFFGKTD